MQQLWHIKLRKALFTSDDGKRSCWIVIWTPSFIFSPITWNSFINEYVFTDSNFYPVMDVNGNIFYPTFIVPDLHDLVTKLILQKVRPGFSRILFFVFFLKLLI